MDETTAPTATVPFDLEAYIGRYPAESETRLQRLLFIAQKSNNADLSKQAFELAERQMKATHNARRYKEVFGSVSNQNHDIMYDAAWVQETEAAHDAQFSTLESRLSAAQAHLNKEAIRTAYLALGDFHRPRGELREALRAVMRSRDYCTSRHQTSHVCLLIIELAMDIHNYGQVHEYVNKAGHSIVSGDLVFPIKLKVADGLAYLAEGDLQKAADKLTRLGAVQDVGHLAVSPEDVALYGALVGMASLHRNALVDILEQHSSAWELVPAIRNVLRCYCRADYRACLDLLNQEELKTQLSLDLHLSPHIDSIYHEISQKCLVEYLRPYKRVSLPDMAGKFGMQVPDLIKTLATLIGNGKIPNCRINCATQCMEREAPVSKKAQTRRKIVQLQDHVLNDAHAIMIRIACMENEQNVDRRRFQMDAYGGGGGGGIDGGVSMDSSDDDDDEPMGDVAMNNVGANPEDAGVL